MAAKPDLRALKDQASRALEKRNFQRAAEIYLEIAQHEDDPDWRQRAGEAFRKANKIPAAVQQLVTAAEGYAARGFIVKAIAVCKVVLQIDPHHATMQAQLAHLYAERDKTGAAAPGPRPGEVLRPESLRGGLALTPPGGTPALTPSRGVPALSVTTPSRGVPALSVTTPPTGVPAVGMPTLTPPGGLPVRTPSGPMPVVTSTGAAPPTTTPPRGVPAMPAKPAFTPTPRPAAPPRRIEEEAIDLSDDDLVEEEPTPAPRAAAPAKTPAATPTAKPAPAPAPKGAAADPFGDLFGLELGGLDEVSAPRADEPPRAAPALEPGAPVGSLELKAILPASKSDQFLTALRDEGPQLVPQPAAYEIALDDAILDEEDPLAAAVRAAEASADNSKGAAGGMPVATPAAAKPAPAPQPAARPAAKPPAKPADDELDFSSLLDEAVAAPAPSRLRTVPLFSSLGEDQLRILIEGVTMRHLDEGERLITEGEPGSSLFIVAAGELRVFLQGPPERELARLGEGEFVGELALLTDFPRSASVAAVGPADVLEVTRDLIGTVIAEHPEVLKVLLRFFRERMVDRLLRTSTLFTRFSPEDARSLVGRLKLIEAEAGLRIVRQGERAPGLFIVLAGEVALLEGDRPVARLGPGEIFGEMSLLARGPAGASLDTATKCWMLELARADFQELMVTYPQLLEFISELADRRERAGGARAAAAGAS